MLLLSEFRWTWPTIELVLQPVWLAIVSVVSSPAFPPPSSPLLLALSQSNGAISPLCAGKAYYTNLEDPNALLEEPVAMLSEGPGLPQPQSIPSPSRSSPHSQGSEAGERFSRKVFVGGLPPDIDEGEFPDSAPLSARLSSRLTNQRPRVAYPPSTPGHQSGLEESTLLLQMRSPPVFVVSAPWWWTGRTRPRASRTSRPRDTRSCSSR